jgi:hypothetical protein
MQGSQEFFEIKNQNTLTCSKSKMSLNINSMSQIQNEIKM